MQSKLIYMYVAIAFVANTACTSSTPNETDYSKLHTAAEGNTDGNFIECKLNGVPVKTDNAVSQILFAPSKKTTTIWGKTPEGIISISIEPMERIGTYIIDGTGKSDAGIQNSTESFSVKENKSRITVTVSVIEEFAVGNTEGKIKAIKGTFEGTFTDKAGNSIQITEGKFSSQ